MVKDMHANSGHARDTGSIPGSGMSPGGGWLPIPVFLPGEPHGQRSLVGYSPRGCKELERLNTTYTLEENAC